MWDAILHFPIIYFLGLRVLLMKLATCAAMFEYVFAYQFYLSYCFSTSPIGNHPGKLVQIGMNMGPRHARVLGWAKSYTKKLDAKTMIEYDQDAVGGLSIMWSFVQSVMPLEVRDHVNSCLTDIGLPHLATWNVNEGLSLICID